MNKQQIIHDLAVSLAKLELQQYRIDNPEKCGYSEEIKFYIKSYFTAVQRITDEYED